jgi:hypothetical protein
MLSIDAVDKHTRWLMDLARLLCGAFKDARINYRMVGGMAVYFHVDMLDPMAARLTPDVDFAIGIRTREGSSGLSRTSPGFLRANDHSRGISAGASTPPGAHETIDMDGVGLITPEIENALPETLRLRLQQVRAEERQSAGAE